MSKKPTLSAPEFELFIKIGQEVVALGKATYEGLRALFAADSDNADDAALSKLDAAYAARIEQAKKDAE